MISAENPTDGADRVAVDAKGTQVTVDVVLSKLTIGYETTVASDAAREEGAEDTGGSADAAVGCVKGADVLLVLETGESLFAHSKYLANNPYFESHFSFLESNAAASAAAAAVKTVRVLPPFPSAFRSTIELIYNFSGKTPEESAAIAFDSISTKQLVPLLRNAQFFQMQPLIDACTRFFVANWKPIITRDYFSPKHLPENSLCPLLDKLVELKTPANIILEVLVFWCSNESREFSETAQPIVEKYLNLEKVSREAWENLALKAPTGLNVCVSSVGVVKNAVNSVGLEVNCSRCGWKSVAAIMKNNGYCSGEIHKAIRNRAGE
ncbi:hypothetical protein BDR26DRAFT_860202 [Obelidium mucronatum]|nr:hypothetical protein BDR26DRAFT_860202 [Obelidium mucronatum]